MKTTMWVNPIKTPQATTNSNSNSGSKQNQQNNNVVTPPKFSQHELANTKTVNQPQYSTQTVQTTGSQYVPPKKEDYDDPNSLSHTKFHSHGPKDLEEKEKAKQIVSDFEKKKKNTQGDDNGRMNLKGVNYHKANDNKDKFYFFLTCVVLTLTGLLIIGACFGSVYFFYKLTFGNKERYFQFDESKGTNSKLDMELAADRKPSNLSKIIEDPDEEANTSIVKGSRITGTTEVTGNKSSVVHCPVAGNMIFDPEYAGDMSKKSSGSGTFTRQSTKDFQ
eukprot:403368007